MEENNTLMLPKTYRIYIKGNDFACLCRIEVFIFDTLQELVDSTKDEEISIKYKDDIMVPTCRARVLKLKGSKYKDYLCAKIQFCKEYLDNRIIIHEAYHAILECFRIAKSKDYTKYEENIVDSSSILADYLIKDLKIYYD